MIKHIFTVLLIFARSYTKEDVEKVIKNCKGWEDLRRNGKLIKDAWSTSLQPILTTLENRIKRLKLCDESLSVSFSFINCTL